jgi:ATP-dependent RNA helicase DeaD
VKGHINILVATDLAAIDVKEISYVVNYHLPDATIDVHRSGRTARAGAGLSLTVLPNRKKKKK